MIQCQVQTKVENKKCEDESATDHECDGVATQTVGKQLGEFAVAVRYVTLSLLGITQRRYAVTYISQTLCSEQ